jgi:DNA-binding LacI/PurR family transcriptional regulator
VDDPAPPGERTSRRRSLGTPRPTLAAIAERLGVSLATVSNAFNRPERLSAELRARILATADQLGYSGPDPVARSLRRGRAGAVAVLVAERPTYAFSDPAGVALLDGLAEVLGSRESGLLILSGDGSGGGPSPQAVAGAAVDAFVLYCLADDDPCLDTLARRRLPVVCIEGPPFPRASTVALDDDAASALLTEHLLGLGHREFAIVTMECRPDGGHGPLTLDRSRAITYGPTRRRLDGCLRALAAAGIDPDGVPRFESAHNDAALGREAAHMLLTSGGRGRPTALVCQSDILALGALAACAELGLDVPGDVSIVGFDDIAAAALADPPLTTARQPLREKGMAAGRLVAAGLDGRRARRITLPVDLVLRGSTGPAPSPTPTPTPSTTARRRRTH